MEKIRAKSWPEARKATAKMDKAEHRNDPVRRGKWRTTSSPGHRQRRRSPRCISDAPAQPEAPANGPVGADAARDGSDPNLIENPSPNRRRR